jgi:hypothetical protein
MNIVAQLITPKLTDAEPVTIAVMQALVCPRSGVPTDTPDLGCRPNAPASHRP